MYKIKKTFAKRVIFTNNSLKVVEEDYISRWNEHFTQREKPLPNEEVAV